MINDEGAGLISKGKSLIETKDYVGAKKVFEDILENADKSTARFVHEALAQIGYALKDFNLALQHIDYLIDSFPQNPDYYSSKAVILTLQGNGEAESFYQKALQLLNNPTDSFFNIGIFLDNDRPESIVCCIERATKCCGRNTIQKELWFSFALSLITRKHYFEAINYLTIAEEQGFQRAELYYCFGLVEIQEKRFEEALFHLNIAIEMRPHYIPALCERAFLFGNTGKLEEAIEDYSLAIKLGDSNAGTWCNRGLVYIKSGKIQKAIEDYSRAIELRDDYIIAYLNRAHAYAFLGKYRTAACDIDKAMILAPDNADVYLSKGIIDANLGRIGDALVDFQNALILDPSNHLAAKYYCDLLSKT